MQRLIESYIATLRRAIEGQLVAPETVLTAYQKVTDYLFTSPSGERATPSDRWWRTEMGQLLARARITANGDLLPLAEFARESNRALSTISYWVQIGKLESIIDPDHFSNSPTGGFKRLIPRSELSKAKEDKDAIPK